MGKWYEQARDKDFFFERGTCVFVSYGVEDNGHVSVTNSEKRNGEFTVATGDATLHDDSGEGWLDVKFSPYAPPSPYKILETDYETYSLVYACGGVGNLYSIENVWIMSREPQISDEAMADLQTKLATLLPKYDQDKYLQMTPQGNDCGYPAELDKVDKFSILDIFL